MGVEELTGMDVTLKILQKTKIGFTLNTVRKEASDERVKKACKDLLKKWKNLEEEKEKGETSSSKKKEESKAEPAKDKKGRLVFSDFPDFQPNLTPKEVLQLGSFGGTYFRPIYSSITGESYRDVWKEYPQDWFSGLNIARQVASPTYRNDIN